MTESKIKREQIPLKTGRFQTSTTANAAFNVKSNYTGTLPDTQYCCLMVTAVSLSNNCKIDFHWETDNNPNGELWVVSDKTQDITVRWFSL